MRDRSSFWMLCGVFLFAALLFGVGSITWLPDDRSRFSILRSVIAIASGIGSGIIAVVLIRVSWRRHGGLPAIRERTRAVSEGVLPESADASWLPGLRARRQNARQYPFFLPAITAVLIVLGTVHLGDPTPLASAYWFVLAVILGVLGIRAIRRGPRDVVVLDAFIDSLRQRPH